MTEETKVIKTTRRRTKSNPDSVSALNKSSLIPINPEKMGKRRPSQQVDTSSNFYLFFICLFCLWYL